MVQTKSVSLINDRVCNKCQRQQPDSEFQTITKNGRQYKRGTCRSCRLEEQKIREHNTIPERLKQELADLGNEIDPDSIRDVCFATTGHDDRVILLVQNTLTLLATFMRYQKIVHEVVNIPIKAQDDGSLDDYHCVAGEELDLIEGEKF